jgi:hypothetical protein
MQRRIFPAFVINRKEVAQVAIRIYLFFADIEHYTRMVHLKHTLVDLLQWQPEMPGCPKIRNESTPIGEDAEIT